MIESWKPLAEATTYEVSDLGRVRSWALRGSKMGRLAETPQLLVLTVGENGYPSVQIHGRRRHVHVLVLETFVGPRPARHQARHLNGVRTDCRLINLEWATAIINNADKHAHGTAQNGERHGQAKLTAEIVRIIRASAESNSTLAARYGVDRMTIHQARTGRTWKHISVERGD